MVRKFRLLWLLFSAKLGSFVNADLESSVVALTAENVDHVLADHDAVIMNFYASWCPYSEMFEPTFLEAGNLLREKFSVGNQKVVAAATDQTDLVERFGVSKYPTVKLALYGKVLDNEYRGKREAKSILNFVEDYLSDATITLNTPNDFDQISTNKPAAIAYVTRANNEAHKLVVKIASWMKHTCQIYVTSLGDYLPSGTDLMKDHVFLKEEDNDVRHSTEYSDHIENSEHLFEWLKARCHPTVEELTFENAEELSEPGIPFLVLFRHKDDANSLQLYKSAIRRELAEFVPQDVRTLIADGNRFIHPLHRAGKTEADLPVILLDSFYHMFVFKNFKDIEIPGKLKQFIEDLKSDKLHQDYHDQELDNMLKIGNFYIPELDNVRGEETNGTEQMQEPVKKTVQIDPTEESLQSEDQTRETPAPLESSFKYLQPSKHRYTFKRDEL